MRVPVATALALLLIVVSSCDRLPGDPFEDPESAALAERMRLAVMGVGPLPSLSDMAEFAAPRVAAAEPGLVSTFHALRDSAEITVRSGSREAAERVVTAARDAQLRVVLAGLGPEGVAELIGRAQHRVRRLESTLTGESTPRLRRMRASAADMLERARARLLGGDAIDALDLSAHAIDLLNAVEAASDS